MIIIIIIIIIIILIIIPIMIGAFGSVTKGLLKELEDLEVGGRVETIQTTGLLRTARILREESWRPEETPYHSNTCERQQTLMWKILMGK